MIGIRSLGPLSALSPAQVIASWNLEGETPEVLKASTFMSLNLISVFNGALGFTVVLAAVVVGFVVGFVVGCVVVGFVVG